MRFQGQSAAIAGSSGSSKSTPAFDQHYIYWLQEVEAINMMLTSLDRIATARKQGDYYAHYIVLQKSLQKLLQ